MLELLYQMQNLDLQCRKLQQATENCPQKQALEELKVGLIKKQAYKKQLTEEYNKSLAELKSLVNQLEVVQDNMAKEGQYVGVTPNPAAKDYENHQKKVKIYQLQAANLQEKMVGFNNTYKVAKEKINLITQQIAEAVQAFESLKQEYKHLNKENQAQAYQLQQEKELIARDVDSQWLTWYEENKDKKEFTPIAKIIDDHICSGCYTAIAPILVKRATDKPGSIFCDNCGRLLYRD